MKSDVRSIERVQKLVDSAERLRMQSVAVPLKELQVLLTLCEEASERLNAPSHQSDAAERLLQQPL